MQKQSGLKNPSPFNPFKMNHMLGGDGSTVSIAKGAVTVQNFASAIAAIAQAVGHVAPTTNITGLSKEALKQLEIGFLYQSGVIQFQFGQVGDIPMFADFFNEGISCVVDSTVTTLVIH